MSNDLEEVVEDASVAVTAALELVKLAVRFWPALGSLLGDAVAGKTDAVSLRVQDILPETSASRQAQKDLGG